MTPPKGFNPNDPECPKCRGGMWDNRDDKQGARSPDFKCKQENGDCDGRVWMDPPLGRGQRNGNGRGGRGSGSSGGNANRGAQHQEPAPRMEIPALTPPERKAHRDKTLLNYFGLMSRTAKEMQKIALASNVLLTMDDVQAATYSLFSLMDRKKLLEPPDLGSAPKPVAATTAASSTPPAAANRAPARAMASAGAPRSNGHRAPDPTLGHTEDDLGGEDDLPF